MDRRERTEDLAETFRVAMEGNQAALWTMLPAKVVSYDASKNTVVAQPTIMGQVRSPAGVWSNVTMPVCPDVVVQWPGGGDWVLTFPLASDDEGMLLFACRCIDAWWSQGDVQPQAEFRMHDLSDGFFVPRVFSVPNVPGAISTTAVQLRSRDGTKVLQTTATGFKIVGDLEVTGEITGRSGSPATKITIDGHIHPANNTPPTPGH